MSNWERIDHGSMYFPVVCNTVIQQICGCMITHCWHFNICFAYGACCKTRMCRLIYFVCIVCRFQSYCLAYCACRKKANVSLQTMCLHIMCFTNICLDMFCALENYTCVHMVDHRRHLSSSRLRTMKKHVFYKRLRSILENMLYWIIREAFG